MREVRRIAGATATATVGLGVALAVGPLPVERILAAYVLVLAAIALAALTRIARVPDREEPSRFELALGGRAESPVRPAELIRVERELSLGAADGFHLERRLLPLLRDAAAARLAVDHGVDLERQPEAARGLLGDAAWELLRPDRPRLADRDAPGLPLARVRSVVETLERL